MKLKHRKQADVILGKGNRITKLTGFQQEHRQERPQKELQGKDVGAVLSAAAEPRVATSELKKRRKKPADHINLDFHTEHWKCSDLNLLCNSSADKI